MRKTGRGIRAWEKQAAKAAKLRLKAGGLLRQAEKIELTQKRLFESVVLETAYAAKLHELPLSTIVAGLQALRDAADGAETDRVNTAPAAQVIKGNVDDWGDNASAATIALVVKIGRNASPRRFALLNQYLTWNGKDGQWSGMVSRATLAVFEATFESERLIFSREEHEWADIQPPNTASQAFDNSPEASGGATQATSQLVVEIDEAQQACVNGEEGQPGTTAVNAVEGASPAADDAKNDGEAADERSASIPSSDSHQAADLAATGSPSEVGTGGPGDLAGMPPELLIPRPTSSACPAAPLRASRGGRRARQGRCHVNDGAREAGGDVARLDQKTHLRKVVRNVVQPVSHNPP